MNPVHKFSHYYPKIHSNIILPSNPRSSDCIFPSGFPTNIFYVFFISPMRAMWSSHTILLDLIPLIKFGEAYKIWSSSLCSVLQPLATSFLLGPNILLSTLFPNPSNLRSDLSLRDQVSRPYKTAGKIIVACIYKTKESEIIPKFNVLLISSFPLSVCLSHEQAVRYGTGQTLTERS